MSRFGADRGVFRRVPLAAPGSLFVSPMPHGAYDRGGRLLAIYERSGVEHVVVLATDDELARKARRDLCQCYSKLGISYTRHPIRDLQSASIASLESLVENVVERLRSGQRVALHCHAGVGRTALAAACIGIRADGLSGGQAIEHVKRNMDVRITDEQVSTIHRFSAH